jgi:hypothetical protein
MSNIVRRVSKYDYEFKYLYQTRDKYIMNLFKRVFLYKMAIDKFFFQQNTHFSVLCGHISIATFAKLMVFEKN